MLPLPKQMEPRPSVSYRTQPFWWLLLLFGLCVSLLMAWRSQLGGDQYQMLQLGWTLVKDGQLLPYGMRTSAGGRSPGGLLGLLVALPLWAWRDYRAPAVFIVILHLVAFLVLAHSMRHSLSRSGLWLLLILVWLNPWRLYFSATVWDPNLMFVAAVVHLATAKRMAARPAPWATALHVLNIGLALQVHSSAAVLVVTSLLLFWKRMIQVHWPAFAIGAAILVAAYAPWFIAVEQQPGILPGHSGFMFHGLLSGYSFARGILYWLQMPSLSLAPRTLDFDFDSSVGPNLNRILAPLCVALGVLAYVTLVPSTWAHWRFFRRRWRFWESPVPDPERRRSWLRSYVTLIFAATLLCFAISPTTTMFWQVLVALPAAALLLVLTVEALLRTRVRGTVLRITTAWCVLAISLTLAQAFGAPMYRCGGRHVHVYDDMLQQLHAPQACFMSPRNPNDRSAR